MLLPRSGKSGSSAMVVLEIAFSGAYADVCGSFCVSGRKCRVREAEEGRERGFSSVFFEGEKKRSGNSAERSKKKRSTRLNGPGVVPKTHSGTRTRDLPLRRRTPFMVPFSQKKSRFLAILPSESRRDEALGSGRWFYTHLLYTFPVKHSPTPFESARCGLQPRRAYDDGAGRFVPRRGP